MTRIAISSFSIEVILFNEHFLSSVTLMFCCCRWHKAVWCSQLSYSKKWFGAGTW